MSGPQMFGRYRVTGTLGAGAMGEVLAAVDELLGREVAVKTLKGRSSGLAARIADERFRLEARAIAQLTHPSVVQVYDLDLTADPPYLVMERVAGPSLKEKIAEGPLAEHDVRALGIQIANALAAAHARGVVHRDVKPANILAAGPGVWKLADFGVAHVPDSSLTMTGQFVGSPAYAAPEALVRGQLGPEGDVFGLGATLYQAAAGTWPRADAETRGLLASVPPIRSVAPHVAEDLAAAIDRACSLDPAARPTASQLALALAAASTAGMPAASASGMHAATPAPGVHVATPAHGLPVPGTAGTHLGSMSGMHLATPTHGVPAAGTHGVQVATPAHGLPTGSVAGGPLATPLATVSVPDHLPGGLATSSSPGVAAVALPAQTFSGTAAGATAAGETAAGATAAAAPNASKFRTKHMVAGIVTLLVVVLIAVTRSSPSPPSNATTTAPGTKGAPGTTTNDRASREGSESEEPPLPPREPGVIRALPPQITTQDRAAAKDWNKVVDKLYNRDFGEARRKLAEFETKHGETRETHDLAEQLDAEIERMRRQGGRYEED